jgi:hypothetical protein
VDANESPAVAKELYASRAKDKVVVFDRDPNSPTGYSSKPRVFADGLAIPLGILPYTNGVYVQHGPDIVFLSDTDGDGKADKREVILSGFGVQDSHLFPHQFTRAPGNWIWMAQGAFNYGKVRTKDGKEQQFDQTRMAKFRYDGSDFDITSQGPCNIWGLVLDGNGQAWIQEANDFGYPMMPFHEYANYPGCSQAQWKSYAPEFPGTATEFAMGGTGLSGLALSDSTGRSRGNETQTKGNLETPYVVSYGFHRHQIFPIEAIAPVRVKRQGAWFDLAQPFPSRDFPRDESLVAAAPDAKDSRRLQLAKLPTPAVIRIPSQQCIQACGQADLRVAFKIERVTRAGFAIFRRQQREARPCGSRAQQLLQRLRDKRLGKLFAETIRYLPGPSQKSHRRCSAQESGHFHQVL